MALGLVALVTLATALGVQLAFAPSSAGRPALFLALGVPYALFSALAIVRARRAGGADGATAVRPLRLGLRSGDVSFGCALALALGAASAGVRYLVLPRGSPAELWLVRIYLQFGEVPRERGAYLVTAGAVVAVALLEELTWRGLVQSLLEERFGPRRAWLVGALLFGAAHLPTLWQLSAPGLGPNPLVVLAALGCGAVWGFCAGRLRRLGPSLASHALYTYGLTMLFRLWP